MSQAYQLLIDARGQATVEYALVLTGLLCVIVGLGVLLEPLRSGAFIEHAVASASHVLVTVFGGLADVFSY